MEKSQLHPDDKACLHEAIRMISHCICKELLNEVLNKEEDRSIRKDTAILSDPSKDEKNYITVQLPEDLFQEIPREAISDYLVGLVKENRRKG